MVKKIDEKLQVAVEAIPKVVPCSRVTVWRWCREGRVNAVRIGGRYYITGAELARIRTEGTLPAAK